MSAQTAAPPDNDPTLFDDHEFGSDRPDQPPARRNGGPRNAQPDNVEPIYTDIAALLDGTLPEPPQPCLLTRTDGRALFYPGRVNSLFGDPENGKTWVALAAIVEALRAARKVLLIDLDHNGAEAIVAHLLMLGAPIAALRNPDQFRHCEPDDAKQITQVVNESLQWRPAVAVIDSLGELLPVLGCKSNDDDEYTIANGRVLQPLANAGAAVIVIDHLAKNITSRAIGQGGAVAKRRALGGTAIRVKTGRQFVPGKGGTAHLTVNKDRHGQVRRHCPSVEREPLAGTFVMDPPDESGAIGWRVLPPLEPSTTSGLEDKTSEILAAARQLDASTFSAKDVALQHFPNDPPTTSQIKQATYHLEQLAKSGHLEQIQKGQQGRGASRWRLAETAGQGNPKSETFLND